MAIRLILMHQNLSCWGESEKKKEEKQNTHTYIHRYIYLDAWYIISLWKTDKCTNVQMYKSIAATDRSMHCNQFLFTVGLCTHVQCNWFCNFFLGFLTINLICITYWPFKWVLPLKCIPKFDYPWQVLWSSNCGKKLDSFFHLYFVLSKVLKFNWCLFIMFQKMFLSKLAFIVINSYS